MFNDATEPAQGKDDSQFFQDSVLLGQGFVDYTPYDHPLYGEIEIGGYKRQHGRVAPSFLIEEMLHRNAAFCLRHAEEIARIRFSEIVIEELGDGLTRIRVALLNDAMMPSRSALAAREHLGTPDLVTIAGDGIEVLAGGTMPDRWRAESFQPVDREPARLRLNDGVPGASGNPGRTEIAWIVRGSGPFTIDYTADQADDAETSGEL